MKTNARNLMAMTIATLALTACMDHSMNQEIEGQNPEIPTESAEQIARNIANSFDFKMTTEVPVTLNYGTKGAFIQIVDANERDLEVAMSGQKTKVLYAAYTDANGKFQGKMVIPTSYIGKTVYAVTKTMGATSNIAATITKNGLTINETAATRAQQLANKNIPAQLLSDIDAALPEEQNNTAKLSEKSNDISVKVNKDVDYVDVTFIYGGAGVWISGHYKDANFSCQKDEYEHDSWFPFDTSCDLYYFLYTDDNVPTKEYIDTYYINDHHRVVDYVNNTNSGIYGHKDDKIGTTVRITQDDGITTKIKAGTRIGWVVTHPYYMYVDIWDASLSGWSVPNLYSISDYNPGGYSQSIRYLYGEGDDQEIIYGMEDNPLVDGIKLWGETWEEHLQHIAAGQPTDQHYFWMESDRDYNDVMFIVKASDPEAIIEKEIPVLPPAPVVYQEESIEGTLLYEDLYPEAGDYDMNDVVVTYRLTKYFDKENKLVKLGYEFTPVWSGANYHSSFSFLMDGWTDVVTVFDDQAKYVTPYQTTEHLRTFTGEITSGTFVGQPKDNLSWETFNPFITVNNTGREVHLPKKAASPNAKLDGLDEYALKYILNTEDRKEAGGEFPYAMNIPSTNYVIVTEKVRIDDAYPKFIQWVTSKGTQAADWYIK